jgi:hypothetical protein
MTFLTLFKAFGWVILLTTTGLLLLPWKWHRRFARHVMPPLIRHGKLFAVGAFLLGACILYGALPR